MWEKGLGSRAHDRHGEVLHTQPRLRVGRTAYTLGTVFLLVLPAIAAYIIGFSAMGDGGNCVIAGNGLFSIECGVSPNVIVETGIVFPEPFVSWGLVLLGTILLVWVGMYYRTRFRGY